VAGFFVKKIIGGTAIKAQVDRILKLL